jgi:hypothetical protein
MSRTKIDVASPGLPAATAALARSNASPPSGGPITSGGSYKTAPAQAFGDTTRTSSATTAPDE